MASPNDIAFVVGVDDYSDAPLDSCVKDAERIAELLAHNDDGSDNFNVNVKTVASGDLALSRLDFLDQLCTLLEACGNNDFLFYFSGHGDTNDWGTELVLADDATVNFTELLTVMHRSDARHITVVLDCCYSGAFGLPPTLGEVTGLEGELSLIRDNLTLLAASKSDQPADDGYPYSAFTSEIVVGLEGAAADGEGRVSGLALFTYASAAFRPPQQRPVMKASVSATEALRTCDRNGQLATLRRLATHFPDPQATMTLTPDDFVPDGEAPTTSGQFRYRDIATLYAAQVVEIEGGDLVSIATAESVVRLTAAGRAMHGLCPRA